MTTFHPDLHGVARFIPKLTISAWMVPLLRRLIARIKPAPLPEGVTAASTEIPGAAGAPPIHLRVYRPTTQATPVPALLWVHGGGFIIGSPQAEEAYSVWLAKELGIVVVAVKYRLAPENPFPAAMDDCYAALKWLFASAEKLQVDAARIAIGGASAGGGLAAGLALLARDRQEVKPVFQLLVYPMLDDRTAARTDIDESNHRVWRQSANRYGWQSYLGQAPGSAVVPTYASPSRETNLRELPPAWIGVGTFDLFYDEDLAYAQTLNQQGVPCQVEIVPGAFHGFEAVGMKTPVVQGFRSSQLAALRRALFA